ncbi:MAG TPA: hypothetical protein PK340_04265 [Bacilli bacterium]|nr:hypothetical protein [Bacilli bacterium]
MIKCMQNRVWMINHFLSDAHTLKTVNLIEHPLFEFNYEARKLRSDEEQSIAVKFKPEAIKQLQTTLDEKIEGVAFDELRLHVNDLGYLAILIVFEYRKPFDFRMIETDVNVAVKTTINDHLELFETLVDFLADHGFIIKSKSYHFGVPTQLIETGEHTRKRSYLFNNHYFFIDEDNNYQTLKNSKHKDHDIYLDLPVELFTVNDSQWFWKIKKDDYTPQCVDKLLYPNFLALIESQVYSNAVFCYSAYLNLIAKDVRIDNNIVRDVINTNNLRLLKVKMLRPMLRHYQITHIEHHHQFHVEGKKLTYQTALENLNYAIEGLDTKRNQQANALIQQILAFFTFITIYSVVTDIYMLLTSEDNQTISIISIIILSMVTVFLLTLLIIISRKIERPKKLKKS